MDDAGIRGRVRAVRVGLSGHGMDCLILTKPANVSYVTGFSGEESWAVVCGRGVYLLTDSRYVEQAEQECRLCRVIERKGPLAAAVGKLVLRLKSIGTIGVENWTSIGMFDALKKNVRAKVKSVAGIVEGVRTVKGKEEIAAIRAAIGIAGKAFSRLGRYVRTGVSESGLAGGLDYEIRMLGGTNSFETIVAFGAHASRPHHRPTSCRLKASDTVLIDFGVRYEGYCCDLTRCFAVGRRNDYYQKVHRVVQAAQAAAIKKIRAGVDVLEVDRAAREAIKSSGFPVFGHGTGHGIGLEVHEGPLVSASGKGKLDAGMVITVEPGVYMPGRLGVRIEDDVLVSETGCEVLSRGCSQEMVHPW
jgi:Xaa-Pro aminopeptidase